MDGGASGAEFTGSSGWETTEVTRAGSKPACGEGADWGIDAVGAGSMENGLDANRVTSLEQPASVSAATLARARREAEEKEF